MVGIGRGSDHADGMNKKNEPMKISRHTKYLI
jgi:hypothetical protein